MRLLLLLAGMFSLCHGRVAAQTYDVNCPGGLNQNFYNYEPVSNGGYDFYSQWLAKSPVRPLPSQSWYYAYPKQDIISTDREAIWTHAEILVHCWVFRNIYVTVVHYDPIGYAGYVRALPQPGDGGCGGDEYMTFLSPPAESTERSVAHVETSEAYDPYDPECGGGGSAGDGEGDGDGGGGVGDEMTFAELCSSLNGRLYYDYLCLQKWNEDTGAYDTVWCGTAAICET